VIPKVDRADSTKLFLNEAPFNESGNEITVVGTSRVPLHGAACVTNALTAPIQDCPGALESDIADRRFNVCNAWIRLSTRDSYC
jgi:hypothetical protein